MTSSERQKMYRFAALLSASFVTLGLLTQMALAQEARPLTWQEQGSLTTRSMIRAGDSIDQVLVKAESLFATTDIDGNGVSKSDQELRAQIESARKRGQQLGLWLHKDLDGDGDITLAELKAFFQPQIRRPIKSSGVSLIPTDDQMAQMLDKLVTDALKPDQNGDKLITSAELQSFAEAQARAHRGQISRRHSAIPMDLDRDGDGTVTRHEFLEVVTETLNETDLDGDKSISSEELKSFGERNKGIGKIVHANKRAKQQKAQILAQVSSCNLSDELPQPSDSAGIVLLGTTRGKALSTVSLGGDDAVVTVADVKIEPGSRPLFMIVAAREAIIWRFSGAIDRVANLVMTSKNSVSGGIPRVGVVGVPANRVHFSPNNNCWKPFSKPESRDGIWMTQLLPVLFGRGADVVVGENAVSQLSLPGGLFSGAVFYKGAVNLPTEGDSALLLEALLNTHPGGLVEIKPDTVVSATQAKRYTVMPREAGLIQLLDEGALEVLGHHLIVDTGGTRIILPDRRGRSLTLEDVRAMMIRMPDKFLILKKIQFPAGLRSIGSVNFVLSRDAPAPDGKPDNGRAVKRQGE